VYITARIESNFIHQIESKLSNVKLLEKIKKLSKCSAQFGNLEFFGTKLSHISGSCRQGRNEGGKGDTIPRMPNHYGDPESLRRRRKVPTISQVLSSMQYICFRKTSGSNIWAPNLLLARHLTSLRPWL